MLGREEPVWCGPRELWCIPPEDVPKRHWVRDGASHEAAQFGDPDPWPGTARCPLSSTMSICVPNVSEGGKISLGC